MKHSDLITQIINSIPKLESDQEGKLRGGFCAVSSPTFEYELLSVNTSCTNSNSTHCKKDKNKVPKDSIPTLNECTNSNCGCPDKKKSTDKKKHPFTTIEL